MWRHLTIWYINKLECLSLASIIIPLQSSLLHQSVNFNAESFITFKTDQARQLA
jgi:hypothetical protein